MGFVAGTLVHTKNGLVPIEQIKVGDWVLSKPESGEGETRYKLVVNTFTDDDKALYLVGYYIIDENLPEGGKIERLMVTGNHPFWVRGIGWTRADQLYQNLDIEFADGRGGYILAVEPMFVTEQPYTAWVETPHGNKSYDSTGHLVTITGTQFDLPDHGMHTPFPSLIPVVASGFDEAYYFKRRVYNFEVADDHTYFVGELGYLTADRLAATVGQAIT